MDRVGIGFLLLLGCAGGWWAWGHYQASSEAVAGVAPRRWALRRDGVVEDPAVWHPRRLGGGKHALCRFTQLIRTD